MDYVSIAKEPSQEEKLASQKMAEYIEKITKHPNFIAGLGDDFATNRTWYSAVGGALVNYATSTGDYSKSGADGVLKDMLKNREDFKSLSEEQKKDEWSRHTQEEFNNYNKELIEKSMLKQIAMQVKRQLDTTGMDNIDSMEEIIKTVKSNQENGFYTHSFNGALLDNVDKDGLDISQETFQEEYSGVLKDSMPTSTQGELCLTPASQASFNYTYDVPERFVWGPLGGLDNSMSQEKSESLEDFYKRRLEKRIQTLKMDGTQANEFRQAVLKMIDFYAKPKTAGIAVVPRSILGQEKLVSSQYQWEEMQKPIDIRNKILNEILEPRKVIKANYQEYLADPKNFYQEIVKEDIIKGDPLELGEELQEELRNLRNNNSNGNKVKDIFNKIPSSDKYKNICEKHFFWELEKHTNAGFYAGDHEGIKIKGGKIPREYFAVAEVPQIDHLTHEITKQVGTTKTDK